MGIREWFDKLRHKKEKYKEFEEEMDVQEKYYEKKKSANERELERFVEENRQKRIKEELDKFRAYRQEEAQYGNQILKVKNMFNGSGNEILDQKNIFRHKSTKQEGLFFK